MFFYSIWFESYVDIAITVDPTHCIGEQEKIPITSDFYLVCINLKGFGIREFLSCLLQSGTLPKGVLLRESHLYIIDYAFGTGTVDMITMNNVNGYFGSLKCKTFCLVHIPWLAHTPDQHTLLVSTHSWLVHTPG